MKIEQYKDWKHFADRDPKRGIKYLVVHCFALEVPEMIKVCNELGVGPHYIIDHAGKIIQLVSEDKVAWHAGKSHWRGEDSLNGSSIGIELQNMSLGQTEYPKAQMDAFVTLVKDIMNRHHIKPENVVGHSDVAVVRKVDPNTAFPWQAMAGEKIGLWPIKTPVVSHKRSRTLLREIGYDVQDIDAALYAFMRRFMPERVAAETDISHAEENLPSAVQKHAKMDKQVRQRLVQVAALYAKNR